MRWTRVRNVLQIAFMPRLFPVNCYLVEENDGLTLIDAALPFSVDGILRAADSIGKPIARIVLTHAHSDHIGALDGLKAKLPEVQVLISARDARLLAGDRTLLPGETQAPVKGGVPKPGQVMTVPDILLKDGDEIGSLSAIAVPGHTPGSMAFWDSRTGDLIAGDAFQVRGGIAVSGKLQPLFPFPAWATWSREDALTSAKRLLELKPSMLAAGHGDMLEEPTQVMRKAVVAAERSLSKASEQEGGEFRS